MYDFLFEVSVRHMWKSKKKAGNTSMLIEIKSFFPHRLAVHFHSWSTRGYFSKLRTLSDLLSSYVPVFANQFLYVKEEPLDGTLRRTRCVRGYGTLARQFSICLYPIQWCTAEIETPRQWNLIGRNMSAPPLVLTPSSILPPSSFQSSFIRPRKNSGCFSKILFEFF